MPEVKPTLAVSKKDREALLKIATGIPSLYEVSLLDDQQLVAAIVRHRRDSLLQHLAFCVAQEIRHSP